MLRYHNYNIVFQEVPGEITLAINLTNCPNGCKGCHSSYLQENTGKILNENVIEILLKKYGDAITCICFMGGDSDSQTVEKLSLYVRNYSGFRLKTAWYSGRAELPESCSLDNFNFIKLGPYVENLGGLASPTTNQHFYRIENSNLIDETHHFQRKNIRQTHATNN
ncbi:MAG: anaerobic ribonucleoside-triphosphate reductase activating protein [Bacteroidetes bacterium]|nr:anaerobic ribonucleoside-triphosphate reductase activating protein [Bacteroidota bacterium]